MVTHLDRVAVIVVNYGTADLAARAVESVLTREHGGRAVEIHLVDNASPGGDAGRLREIHRERGWSDRVRLWPEVTNHGFGRGNNVVLTALAADPDPPAFVLLLNPDAILENETLEILAAALDAEPAAAAAGAAIALPDGTTVTSAFRFPSPVSAVLEVVNFGPLDRFFAGRRVPLPPDHPEGRVDWVSGAAVMFRFRALQEVGYFAPEFFLYFEETELQHRLRAAGWTSLFVPRARVQHAEGASTGQFGAASARRRRPEYLYRSIWIYFSKTHGHLAALGIALLVIPAGAFNVVQRRLRGRAPTVPLGFFRDHCRYGLLPLLFQRGSA